MAPSPVDGETVKEEAYLLELEKQILRFHVLKRGNSQFFFWDGSPYILVFY